MMRARSWSGGEAKKFCLRAGTATNQCDFGARRRQPDMRLQEKVEGSGLRARRKFCR